MYLDHTSISSIIEADMIREVKERTYYKEVPQNENLGYPYSYAALKRSLYAPWMPYGLGSHLMALKSGEVPKNPENYTKILKSMVNKSLETISISQISADTDIPVWKIQNFIDSGDISYNDGFEIECYLEEVQ